jgi:peptide/nickel transport system substrate-binding protein
MTSLGRLLGALVSLMPALFVTFTSGGIALAQTGSKATTSPPAADHAPVVLRVVMHSPLGSLDPVAHSAYITRDHGYLIYDTLFAQDAQGVIRPQMVDHWTVSENRLTWEFNLRAGLLFHDAQPVTSEDVIASIRRWASRDVMGQWLFRRVKSIEAIDQTSFRIRLTEPTGLMLDALGRASSLPLFVMPARLAKTPSQISITEFIGSGPFMFKADEFEPSARSVYVKFSGYKPRVEPASGLAGGKVAKVDRIEWRVINDPQTAARALLAGEIDLIEQPSPSLISELGASPQVNLLRQNPLGNQYALRFNSQLKPFDDPRVRRAVLLALDQQAILKAVHGELGEYRPCKALFVCATPLASDLGFEGALEGRADDARALLAEAGYDGTPIVLLHATDLKILAALAPEARAQLERAGFKVEMQSMTWQELVVRRNIRDPGDQGRWHAFFTSWSGADVGHPVGTAFLNADCQTSIMGWPCDPAFEKLREAFAAEPDLEQRKAMIPKIQEHFAQSPTHVHLGQWFRPMAVRRAVLGLIEAPVPVFWNIEKREP